MVGLESLTVRELLHEADLSLVTVTGDVGLDRVIRGIHLSDLADPTVYMTPGMVLLTTGEVFATAPEPGLRLLGRLREAETAALGVGVGHYLEHVWPEMLVRARELRIAVFEAPLGVPFRTITSYVYNALASTDMHRLRRSLAVQGHLLELMLQQRGVHHLVDDLAAILEAEVVLLDAGGGVIAAAGGGGPGTAARVWNALSEREGDAGPLGIIEQGPSRIYVRRVVVYGILERVLAAVTPSAAAVEFVDTALSFTQRLLVLERLQEQQELMLRRRMRSLLLDDFLSGHGSPEDCLPRLREEGVDLSRPWRVVVFDIDAFRSDVQAQGLNEEAIYRVKSRFIDAVDRYFSDRGVPFLSMVKGDSVVSLLVTGDAGAAVCTDLLASARVAVESELTPFRISVGASAANVGLLGGGRFLQEAFEALKMSIEGLGAGDKLVLFELAGGRFRLVEGQSVDSLRAIRDRMIAPLADYDLRHHASLVRTLRTYIDNRLSPTLTAEALFIHRNTLRKRLARIEALLDVDLDRMDDVVELHLALRAGELLEAQRAEALQR